LSRSLIAGAIGESGAFFGESLAMTPLEEGERRGAKFAEDLHCSNIAELRQVSAERLLDASKESVWRFGAVLDHYFFTETTRKTWAGGRQAHVPLLAGWNGEEGGPDVVLGSAPATPSSFAEGVRRLYPDAADRILAVYPAGNDVQARQAATDLASDRFIGYGTWKWTDLQAHTGSKPVFRYLYLHPRPGEDGAHHSAEIEYAMGNLDRNPHYTWTEDDRSVSQQIMGFFVNFIKTGDPNGEGLPNWRPLAKDGSGEVMNIDIRPSAQSDDRLARYRVLDSLTKE
jgi:para-nitrobenzyl esterase